jgi:hypothetical protein
MGNVAVTTSQQLPFEHDANSSNMELNGLPRGRPGGPLFFFALEDNPLDAYQRRGIKKGGSPPLDPQTARGFKAIAQTSALMA